MQEKAPERCQVGTRETERSPRWGSLLTRRYTPLNDVKTGCLELARDEPGGCPLTGQVASGVEARPFQDHDVSPRMANGLSMDRQAQRVASVTSARPERRRAQIARLRRAAMTLGPDRVLTCDLSSW